MCHSCSLRNRRISDDLYAFDRRKLDGDEFVTLNPSDSHQLSDSDAVIDEIKHERNKWTIAGLPVFFALIIFMLSLLIIPQILGPIFIQGLVVSMIITMVGMGMIVIGSAWGGYLRRIKILKTNFPTPITVTKNYAVTKQGNTYIFSYRRGSYGLYFVALKQASIVPADGIHVPGRMYRSSPGAHFEGLRVRDTEGTFSIPTPEGNFISGEGILLAVSTYHPSYLVVGLAASAIPRSHITEDNLRQVAEYADRYISQKPDDGLNTPGF